jgi:branched-chain amino acid transport system ATP-binding protein
MFLSVEDVAAGYGRIEVLHGISIEVPEGGQVGLFGPNGHGKTTLLRVISGLLPARGGRVRFGAVDLTGAGPERIVDAGIIHVPQGSTLFPRMTVLEVLTLGAYTARAWQQRRENFEKVFGLFPRLAERRGQQCRTLSGGERQMAAIAIGLMGSPRLLMLDEPTLGLAPKVRTELEQRIRAIAESGVSMIVVDQDVELLFSLCRRLYLIEQGRVSLDVADRGEMQHQEVLHRYFGAAHA